MDSRKQSVKPNDSVRKSRSNSKKRNPSNGKAAAHGSDYITLQQSKIFLSRQHFDPKKERAAKQASHARIEQTIKLQIEAQKARQTRAKNLKSGKIIAVKDQQKKTKTQELAKKVKSAEEYGAAKKLKAKK